MTELIDRSKIRTDGGTQSRAGTDQTTVAEYAAAMKEGAVFPPVVVYFDGETYWLGDGFHRVAAAAEAGIEQIDALVRQGTRRDAVLHSVGANSTHGLKRTNADKRRAVETLLLDEEWAAWADREIARRAGVSPTFVGTIRDALKATVQHLQSDVRKGADGRAIDTAKIGDRHWSDVEYQAAGFWADVDRFGLDRATVLDQLQPGCVSLRDLALSRKEANEALEQLVEAQLRRSYPLETWVVNLAAKSRELARVTDYSGTGLRVHDPYPGHYAYIWTATTVRPATDEEVAEYQVSIRNAEQKAQVRSAAAGKSASRLALDDEKADDAAILALGWRERYEAMRARIPAKAKKPLLAAVTGSGHLVLGDDAVAAGKEKKLYNLLTGGTSTTWALAGKESSWEVHKAYPEHNVFFYVEPGDVSFERALYETRTRGKAAFLPGDLVRDTRTDLRGVVASINDSYVRVAWATFTPGEHTVESAEIKHLALVQSWTPGEPELDPGVRPQPAMPPLPWTRKGGYVVDADGERLVWTGGGDAVAAYWARWMVSLVNCPASAYTGDSDVAAALDRVGRWWAAGATELPDGLAADLDALYRWLNQMFVREAELKRAAGEPAPVESDTLTVVRRGPGRPRKSIAPAEASS